MLLRMLKMSASLGIFRNIRHQKLRRKLHNVSAGFDFAANVIFLSQQNLLHVKLSFFADMTKRQFTILGWVPLEFYR